MSSGTKEEVIDQRKRKRMQSNRESARRSRERKQKHLDELNTQKNQLSQENAQIANAINNTVQHYLSIEAENSVLRTQMIELSSRLQSLNEILNCKRNDNVICFDDDMSQQQWSMPLIYNTDMHQYC